MTHVKSSSGKAEIETRFNPVQRRWRCHIAVGKKRVGPLFVRVLGDADDAEVADEAARMALMRAVERGLVREGDIETEDGVPVVHAEGGKWPAKVRHVKAKVPMPKVKAQRPGSKVKANVLRVKVGTTAPASHMKANAPSAKVKAKVPAPQRAVVVGRKAPIAKGKPAARPAPQPKRPAPPMGKAKATAIVGNGRETRDLENLYHEVKTEYHAVGDALKERHLAIESLAAQPE